MRRNILALCAIGLSLLLTLLLLELHVTMVEHSTSHFVDAHLLLTGEAQNVNGVLVLKGSHYYLSIHLN